MLHSIRKRIIFVYVSLSVIIFIIYLIFFGTRLRGTLFQGSLESSIITGEAYASNVGLMIENFAEPLMVLSKYPEVQNLDKDQILNRLKLHVASKNGVLLNGVYIDIDGLMTDINGVEVDVRSMFYYDLVQYSNNNYEVIRMHQGAITGDPIFSIGVPIKDQQGNNIGAIGVSVDVYVLEKTIKAIDRGQASYGWITDNTGRVVVHPNPAYPYFATLADARSIGYIGLDQLMDDILAFDGAYGTYYDVTTDQDKLLTYSEIPGTNGWSLNITTSNSDIYSKANEIMLELILLSAFLTLVSIVLIYVFANRLTRPLIALARDMFVGEDNIFARVEAKGSAKEIVSIADAYNKAARQINHHSQALNHNLGSAETIAKIGFWEYEAEHKKIFWSDGVYDIFEVATKGMEVTYEFCFSFLSKSDQVIVKEKFYESIQQKAPYFISYQVHTGPNTNKYVEVRGEHYYDIDGNHSHTIGSVYDITEKRLNEKKYESILDNASDGIHIIDTQGNLVEYSHSFAETLGYDLKEMKALSVYDWDAYFPVEAIESVIMKHMEVPGVFETKHRRKDGSVIDVQINAKGIDLNGKKYLYASQRDISARKVIQKELEDTTKRWQFAVEGNKDGLWDWNVATNQVFFSPQCRRLLGYDASELKDSMEEWRKLVHPEDIGDMVASLQDYIKEGKDTYTHEHRMLCKNGAYLWVRERGIILEDNNEGRPHRLIGTITDISENIATMKLLEEQAYMDGLTQLQNRKAYDERLTELIKGYQRYGYIFSMIMLDVDDFKLINDTYGHVIGDEVLIELADILKHTVRVTDHCYRIGGEEMVVLASGSHLEQAADFAEKIRQAIQLEMKSLSAYGHEVTVSIGVVRVMEGDSEDSIYSRVDACMYLAKKSGKNKVVVQ